MLTGPPRAGVLDRPLSTPFGDRVSARDALPSLTSSLSGVRTCSSVRAPAESPPLALCVSSSAPAPDFAMRLLPLSCRAYPARNSAARVSIPLPLPRPLPLPVCSRSTFELVRTSLLRFITARLGSTAARGESWLLAKPLTVSSLPDDAFAPAEGLLAFGTNVIPSSFSVSVSVSDRSERGFAPVRPASPFLGVEMTTRVVLRSSLVGRVSSCGA